MGTGADGVQALAFSVGVDIETGRSMIPPADSTARYDEMAEWMAVAARMQAALERSLTVYRAALVRAYAIPEGDFAESGYPALDVAFSGGTERVVIGPDLMQDLIGLYAESGWSDIEILTAAVARWSGLDPANGLHPSEGALPGGIDLSRRVALAGAAFYRDCREQFAALTMDSLRRLGTRLQARVTANLGATLASLSAAQKMFGFSVTFSEQVNDRGGGSAERTVTMADDALARGIHDALEALSGAAIQVELLLPLTEDRGRSGASFRGMGGSNAPSSPAEVAAELERQKRIYVAAAGQLAAQAPWGQVLIGLHRAGTPQPRMVALLHDTLGGIETRITTLLDGFRTTDAVHDLLSADPAHALAASFPHGPDRALVRKAQEALGNGDSHAVHLVAEQPLIELYDDPEAVTGLDRLVLARLIDENLAYAEEAAARSQAVQDGMAGAALLSAVLSIAAHVLAPPLAAAATIINYALLAGATVSYARQLGILDKTIDKTLTVMPDSGLARIGALLAVRRDLGEAMLESALVILAFRQAAQMPRLRRLVFGYAIYEDFRTIFAALPAKASVP